MTIGKLYLAPTTARRRKSTGPRSSSEKLGYESRLSPMDYLTNKSILDSRFSSGAKAESGTKEWVAREFVTKKHMHAMENASQQGNFAGSFRAAGGPTLAALDLGRAAKGHNILEKTIKPGSLKAVYGTRAENIYKIVQDNKLAGIVGAWGGPGKMINGVYVHDRALPGTSEQRDRKFSLSIDDPKKIERFHREVNKGNVIPYTGDYDMHDIIKFNGNSGYVPEADGVEEKEIKDRINRAIAQVDPARPFDFEAMNVVRHGPQVNFVPHMWNHEKDNVIQNDGYLGVVANMGEFPVAFVNRGKWEIVKNWPALYRYYFENNTKIPEHWQQGGLTKRNANYVATDEHALALDKLKGMP